MEIAAMPKILMPSEDRESEYAKVMYEWGQPRINAGDAAAILWESPYSDRYRLWLEKSKRIPRPEQTDAMRSGIITEGLIFEWYQQYKGVTGISQAWAIDDEHSFIQAKSDFWNAERRLLAEFKAPSRDSTKDHETAKAGEIPRHYHLQCLHLIEVFDAAEMDFVSWRSADDFAVIPVKRDTEYWLEYMLPAYAEFWQAIQEDKFPRPQGQDIQTSEEWALWVRRLNDAKRLIAEGERYKAPAEAALKRMATAKTTIGANVRLTWVEVKPRFEIVVTAENADARDRILKAVNPLEGKTGVRKITQRSYPPSLWAKITDEKEPTAD